MPPWQPVPTGPPGHNAYLLDILESRRSQVGEASMDLEGILQMVSVFCRKTTFGHMESYLHAAKMLFGSNFLPPLRRPSTKINAIQLFQNALSYPPACLTIAATLCAKSSVSLLVAASA